MDILTPLRYPGGKSAIADFLEAAIDMNGVRGGEYFEPYAGGAGAALILLKKGVVGTIRLNDIDVHLYAFWDAILSHTSRFVDYIQTVPLNIQEWRRQKNIYIKTSIDDIFSLGFATFYLNRCNRSGIINGAGPIGGHAQDSSWHIGVRFNREKLARRVINIADMKDAIVIDNLDALSFLKKHLPLGKLRKNIFIYLDPPYVRQADRLYLNNYKESDHAKIAAYLHRLNTVKWLLSYDDTQIVRALYADHQIRFLPIKYSLQSKRLAQELVIAKMDFIFPCISLTDKGKAEFL